MATSPSPPGDDFEAIGRAVTSTIRASVHEYERIDETLVDDLVQTNAHNARIYQMAVVHRRMPKDEELDALAQASRRRVHQGIPLTALLRAYRVGARVMWDRLSRERADLDPDAVADYTLRYIDCVSSAAEAAYLEERDELLGHRLEADRLTFSRLIENDFESAQEQEAAVRRLGLDPEHPYIAAVIAPLPSSPPRDVELGALLGDLRRNLPGAASALLRRGAVVVMPASESDGVERFLRAGLTRCRIDEGQVHVGVGRPVDVEGDVGTAVRQAERALSLGGIVSPEVFLHHYDSISFYDLFRTGNEIDTFVDHVLGDYVDAETGPRAEDVRTLYIYLTTGMNRKQAASRLGVHPNTLDYRLRNLAQRSGTEPAARQEEAFRLQLAVRLVPVCADSPWSDPAVQDVLFGRG